MADAGGALSEIDSALSRYDPAIAAGGSAPPSETPQSGSYSVTIDDPPPTPGVRFATPAETSNQSPARTAIGTIDAALSQPLNSGTVQNGASPDASRAEPDKPGTTDDMAKSFVSHVDQGALSLLTLPRALRDTATSGETWLADKAAVHDAGDYISRANDFSAGILTNPGGYLYATAKDWLSPPQAKPGEKPQRTEFLPSFSDAKKVMEDVGGKFYEPQTVPGRYAASLGDYVPGAGRNLITGALIPAVASETAGQATKGTGLEPYARVAGGIVGAGTGMIAPHTLTPVKSYAQPFTRGGQEAIAARTLADNTSDIPAARAALDQPAEIVPGSMPTTYQMTGDGGLGQLERKQRMSSETTPAYIDRDRSQNAARMDVLHNLQPTGSPVDVANRFAQMRDELDRQAQARIDALTPAAHEASSVLGGQGTAESTGYGLRQPLEAARAAAKQRENELWAAVDPEGTLAAPMGAIKQTAQEVYGSLPRASAANLAPAEAIFRDLAAGYQPVEPFAELQGLRSELADAMRHEVSTNGRSTAYGRMSRLMQAVHDTINGTVAHTSAQEAHAVATGAMDVADTIEARVHALQAKWDINVGRERAYASRSLERTGTGSDGVAIGPASRDSRSLGTASAPRGRVGQAPSDPRVPQEASLQPNFDEAAGSRIRAASDATKQRAHTFDEGTAGNILAPAGRSGQYKMPDAAVPAAVVPSGKPTDALAVRHYLAAGGSPTALSDAMAYSITANSKRLDGTLDPAKTFAWLDRNREALAELPPEVAAKFRTAADAQTAVDEMVAQREQDLAAFNKTALARVAGLQSGESVTNTVGAVFGQKNAVEQMKALANAASSDPAARAGLRRAVVDFMLGRLTSNISTNASGIPQLKADSFVGFMQKNGAVLRQVFEPEELNAMAGVGSDLERALRTHQTKGLTSSPGTAQDLGAKGGSILSEIGNKVGPAGLAMASHVAGAGTLTTVLSFLGAQTIGRMRAAGIANANDLVVKAMLDPALAKRLLAKMPDRPGQGTARALGDQFVRLSRATAAGEFAGMQRPKETSTGR